ncbi:MAG: ABC transporter permease [Burkholderiales bacterium]|nr:ABC transporter permease [Burkholderiales bacterium]
MKHEPIPTDTGSDRILVLESGRTERHYWRDLWHYRELFAILAWRDVSVRYKQTIIGVAWALVRPFLTMVVFTLIFGRIAQLPTEGAAPYAVMVFAGMLPWFLFATILGDGANSLVTNSQLIGKVYFPRIVIPCSTALVAVVDFAISLALLFAIMAWYGFLPGWQIVTLPVFVVLAVLTGLGPAILFSAMTVKFRDVRFVVPFVVQLGIYVSPVGFSSSVVPEQWRLLYSLNPMVGVIDGFRWSIMGSSAAVYWPGFILSLGVIALMLTLGIWFFRKTERSFADHM